MNPYLHIKLVSYGDQTIIEILKQVSQLYALTNIKQFKRLENQYFY